MFWRVCNSQWTILTGSHVVPFYWPVGIVKILLEIVQVKLSGGPNLSFSWCCGWTWEYTWGCVKICLLYSVPTLIIVPKFCTRRSLWGNRRCKCKDRVWPSEATLQNFACDCGHAISVGLMLFQTRSPLEWPRSMWRFIVSPLSGHGKSKIQHNPMNIVGYSFTFINWVSEATLILV